MGLRSRLKRLEALTGPPAETEREREEKRKKIREQAEHANRCHEGDVLPFVIDESGDVFASRDGKPITDTCQVLGEPWYWREAEEWGAPGLVHDEQAEAFYTPTGELALSRDRVDLRYLMTSR